MAEERESAVQEVDNAGCNGEKYYVYHEALQHAQATAHDEQKLARHKASELWKPKAQTRHYSTRGIGYYRGKTGGGGNVNTSSKIRSF